MNQKVGVFILTNYAVRWVRWKFLNESELKTALKKYMSLSASFYSHLALNLGRHILYVALRLTYFFNAVFHSDSFGNFQRTVRRNLSK